MTRIGHAGCPVRRARVLPSCVVLFLSVLAFGLATQTAAAQQTLQQQQAPGVTVQRKAATPNVTRQRGQGTPPPVEQHPQPAPTAPPATVEENVDTSNVWSRLHQHDLSGAMVEFTRLTRAHPQWKPPADLVAALREAESGAAKVQPTARARPSVARRARARPTPAPPAPSGPSADAMLGHALTLVDQGAPMSEIAPDVQSAIKLGKADAWETVGWKLLDHHRPADALEAFTRATPESAIFGRVLAARAAGHEDEASNLACEQRGLSQRLAQACADSIASRQLTAYKAGNYAEAEKLGDQLAKIAPDQQGARVLTAWSAYHLGDPKKAAEIFARLYDQTHDHDIANGLALSLRASGQTDVLRARVAAGDTMLGEIAAAEDADTAWYRKQFDLAATGPSPKPSLSGRDSWVFGAGGETGLISGDPGQNRLHAFAGRLFGDGMVGDVRLAFSVTGADIVTGTPTPFALIGLRPLPDRIAPTSSEGIIQPSVGALWQAPDWTISAGLGLTPLNAAVSPLPIASVSVTRYMDPIIVSGRAFARSVTDSLLSYAGMRDPVTGASWGRVIDMGGSLQTIYLPADRVSLSLTSEAAHLAGDDVADNNRFSFRLDAAYDFRPENYDHLRVGPFASYVHYARNLDFYTFGQGGYYSPNGDTRVGVLIDFLTAEGQTWQIQAKQSVAHGNVSEADSPQYPLSILPRTFLGSRFSAVDTDTQLSGSVLLTDRLILSFFGGYSNAPSYNGYVAGVFLSVSFDDRQGVFSADLPDGSYRPFSVWK
jgi:cellulose synthase operon protein C